MKACVIGSLNIDHVISVDRFAVPGETLRAKSYVKYFGGKGGNQSIACSRLGIETTLVACIGSDSVGSDYMNHLNNHKINTSKIKQSDLYTGTAFIEVDQLGENKIVTIGGANYDLEGEYIESIADSILNHDIYMFCLEIPKETTLLLLKLLKKHHKIVILDPAPFSNFDEEMLKYIDYITPNESEYEHFKKIVLQYNQLNIVLKQGDHGASILKNTHEKHHNGFEVRTIDTVGAGDAFNAGLAYGILNGLRSEEILIMANACGALATRKKGAQEGMPTLKELNEFIKKVSP